MSKNDIISTNEMFSSSETLFKNDDLISVLQKRGLIPDVEITDDKLQNLKQKKAKREFRNTKLLLEQYRTIVSAVSSLPKQIAYELDTPLKDIDDLINKCDIAFTYGDEIVETEIRGVHRTKQLFDIVNKALTAMKTMSDEGELYYKILYYTYIDKKKLKIDEIPPILEISRRTYFRKRDDAIRLFSSILWLAPSRELDLWIDFVTILSGDKE